MDSAWELPWKLGDVRETEESFQFFLEYAHMILSVGTSRFSEDFCRMPVYFDVDGDCVTNLGYADDDKWGNLTKAIS